MLLGISFQIVLAPIVFLALKDDCLDLCVMSVLMIFHSVVFCIYFSAYCLLVQTKVPVIGPVLFIICWTHWIGYPEYLLKYADDVSLLCAQNSRTSVELQITQVINWARENQMAVNLLKTMEMVFRRSNISDDLLPSVQVSKYANK